MCHFTLSKSIHSGKPALYLKLLQIYMSQEPTWSLKYCQFLLTSANSLCSIAGQSNAYLSLLASRSKTSSWSVWKAYPFLKFSSFRLVLNVQLLSCGQLFVTPWTVAHQASLSVEFSRQEYWNGLPFLKFSSFRLTCIQNAPVCLQFL